MQNLFFFASGFRSKQVSGVRFQVSGANRFQVSGKKLKNRDQEFKAVTCQRRSISGVLLAI
jgi:hypothetical protein